MSKNGANDDKHVVGIARDPYEQYDSAPLSELRTVQDLWAQQHREKDAAERRAAEVKQRCHEYYTSAKAHNLVYSVPHRLAGFGRGWLFGLRVIEKLPSATQDSFLCAAILILPNGRLRELRYTYQQGKPRVYQRFSKPVQLANYSPSALRVGLEGLSIFYARAR